MDWIKKNKLTVFLILVVVYLLWRQNRVYPLGGFQYNLPALGGGEVALKSSRGILPVPEAPPTETKERLVVQESSLSLVVKDVRGIGEKIIQKANEVGGFMVSSSLSKPEEAPYANIVVRVPADKLNEVLDYYRKLAVKISSENLYGYDVTDEYVDIEARLATLNKTKAKFEEILRTASKVSDILEVNRELINLQEQIDNLKGRQKYLEQTAKLAKISVYLSTDELALPYTPTKAFRPAVIFKQAVRSLIATLRKIATAIIWLVVFIPVWLPTILVYRFFKKRIKN